MMMIMAFYDGALWIYNENLMLRRRKKVFDFFLVVRGNIELMTKVTNFLLKHF